MELNKLSSDGLKDQLKFITEKNNLDAEGLKKLKERQIGDLRAKRDEINKKRQAIMVERERSKMMGIGHFIGRGEKEFKRDERLLSIQEKALTKHLAKISAIHDNNIAITEAQAKKREKIKGAAEIGAGKEAWGMDEVKFDDLSIVEKASKLKPKDVERAKKQLAGPIKEAVLGKGGIRDSMQEIAMGFKMMEATLGPQVAMFANIDNIMDLPVIKGITHMVHAVNSISKQLGSLKSIKASVALKKLAESVGLGHSEEFTITHDNVNIHLDLEVIMDAGTVADTILKTKKVAAAPSKTK
jgi:hypothetical protein